MKMRLLSLAIFPPQPSPAVSAVRSSRAPRSPAPASPPLAASPPPSATTHASPSRYSSWEYGDAGSADSGTKISGRCVGSAPINLLGITPATVNGTFAITSFRPTTSCARSNQRSQKPSLITTANPAGLPPVSHRPLAVRYLPSNGSVSSASKYCPLDQHAREYFHCPPPPAPAAPRGS